MSGALASIKSKASSGMNRAATAVGIQRTNTEDSNAMDELAEFCPQLTYQQRMIGFGTCFVLGYFITFASFRFFRELIDGNPVPFVILYCKCLTLNRACIKLIQIIVFMEPLGHQAIHSLNAIISIFFYTTAIGNLISLFCKCSN